VWKPVHILCSGLTGGLDPESNWAHVEDGKLRTLNRDILEVNHYLMDRLNGCELDNWLDSGDVPTMTLDNLRTLPPSKMLVAIMDKARQALNDPAQLSWNWLSGMTIFSLCIVLSQGQTKQQADTGHLD